MVGALGAGVVAMTVAVGAASAAALPADFIVLRPHCGYLDVDIDNTHTSGVYVVDDDDGHKGTLHMYAGRSGTVHVAYGTLRRSELFTVRLSPDGSSAWWGGVGPLEQLRVFNCGAAAGTVAALSASTPARDTGTSAPATAVGVATSRTWQECLGDCADIPDGDRHDRCMVDCTR